MVLTSPGLCLCLTALREGKVSIFGWALCSPGTEIQIQPDKLLNSCWLLSMMEKGCSPHTLLVVSSAVQKFWLLYGQVPQCVWVAGIPAEVQGWMEAAGRAAGACDVAEPFLLLFLWRLKLHPCSCSSVGTVALPWFEVAKDGMW